MAQSNGEGRNCIRCGCASASGDQYCKECGAPVINRCMYDGGLLDDPCGHVNGETAAFCSKCGSYTAFHQAGLTRSTYPENKVLYSDELSEMNLFSNPFFR